MLMKLFVVMNIIVTLTFEMFLHLNFCSFFHCFSANCHLIMKMTLNECL